jgi:hypothetical protein
MVDGRSFPESSLDTPGEISVPGSGDLFLPDSCPVDTITEFLPDMEFDGLTGGACYFPVRSPDEALHAPIDYTSICNERFCNERLERMMECHYTKNRDWTHPESPLNRGLYFSVYQFRDADVASRVLPDTQQRLIPVFYPPPDTTVLVIDGINVTSFQGVHDYCSGDARCRRGQHIPLYTQAVVWQQGKYIFHIIYNTAAPGSDPHRTVLKLIERVQGVCSHGEGTQGNPVFFDRENDGALSGVIALDIKNPGMLSAFHLEIPA